MGIIDYKVKGEQALRNLLARSDISDANKAHLKGFIDSYAVSPARKNIFFRHVSFLLSGCGNIQKDMLRRETINSLFHSLRDKLSPAYYTTVVNVSLRFVRWLNNGEKPLGFIDIKNNSKKTQRRDLKPNDMISWDDGLSMVRISNSIQLKAIIMTQLDGGFRPSEFIDLKYGDISKEGKYMVAQVNGKTGHRPVILFDSAPFLQRWMQNHPTKKSDDPLWVMENNYKSRRGIKADSIVGYEYFAISKRLRDLGAKAHIQKPLDFYNFRHSSAVIKKLKNWPVEVAAKNMGHSVEHFTNVYGRLDLKGDTERLNKVFGLVSKEFKKDNPVECQTCGTTNEPHADICQRCGTPLTVKKALEESDRLKREIKTQLIDLLCNDEGVIETALAIKRRTN